MITLRWRLTRTLLVMVLPLWALIGSVAYWSVLHELDEIQDAQMRDVVRPLVDLSTAEVMVYIHRAQESAAALGDHLDFGVMVWDEGGGLLYRSPEAPSLSFAERPMPDGGFAKDLPSAGNAHRVQWLHQPERQRWLAVSVSLLEREELALAMGVGLALPLVLTAIALWPLMWWGVSRALAPLRDVVQAVSRRAGHDLSPIALGDVPSDVVPMVQEVNALMERLQGALNREQRFTADASHELRTPLAGVAAQLEVARGATDDEERQHALERASQALRRATDLTEQLMLLARLDHHSGREVPIPGWSDDVDLVQLTREALADEFETAHAKRLVVALDVMPGDARMAGQALWVRTALRNVVHNAVGHAPEGSEIAVRVQASGDAVEVSVSDQGPGITDELRPLLGQRFARGEAAAARPGTGLGLSIVRRVLDLHGGDWRFSDGPGLTVTLCWPKAGAAVGPLRQL
jgi:two-component system sensor histidine kinase QseC